MGASAKMDVDVSGFVKGMKEAGDSVKVINTMLKQNEAQMKLNGQSEQQMASKASLLNAKLKEQQKAAQNAEQALKAMTDAGVDPASASYQKMQMSLANAQTAMLSTELEIKNLGASSTEAAASADQLTTSVQSIGKKISLDQVIGAIDKITSGLERAAGKAIDFGKQLWDTIMDSAKRADDTATMAEMYGIDLQRFKQMQALVGEGMDTSVEAILKSQSKLKKGIGEGTKAVQEALADLGLSTKQWGTVAGESGSSLVPVDSMELFFKAGKKIKDLKDEFKQESFAQVLFGRSWHELMPLFDKYETVQQYTEALDKMNVSSAEATENAAELADRVSTLENTWTQLKDEIIGAIAPALTDAADSLNGVLSAVLEYLKTEDGKKALNDLSTAVSGLFDDLGKIDPEKVVSGFASILTNIVKGMQWISRNWSAVQSGIVAIGTAFAGLKVSQTVLTFLRLINGFKGLGGDGPVVTPAGENTAARFVMPASVNQAALAAGSWANSTNLTNAGVVWDWFTHDTDTGRWVSNMISRLFGGTDQYVTDGPFSEVSKWWESVKQNWEDLRQGDTHSGESWLDSLWNSLFGDDLSGGSHGFTPEGKVKVPVEPEASEDAAASIASQVGTVTVPVSLVWDRTIGGAGGGMDWNVREQRANGWPFVPYDGMLARLHKGEAVVPAREVLQSRNFSSNLYVESMYMNSGVDAAGLASAIAAANRRTMSGYGS